MPIEIPDVYSPEEASNLRQHISQFPWEEGRKTAGYLAAPVKNNLQLVASHATRALGDVVQRLLDNRLFNTLVRPQAIGVLFSRYPVGASYGLHMDSAQMGEPLNAVRRDVSFTIFLSEPSDYDGGELLIEHGFEDAVIKLNIGAMIVYPATSLHRVTEVTRGERFVIVGWARSLIRDAAQRELLFELDVARASLSSRLEKTHEMDLLAKCSANLLRMWMED